METCSKLWAKKRGREKVLPADMEANQSWNTKICQNGGLRHQYLLQASHLVFQSESEKIYLRSEPGGGNSITLEFTALEMPMRHFKSRVQQEERFGSKFDSLNRPSFGNASKIDAVLLLLAVTHIHSSNSYIRYCVYRYIETEI